MQQLRIEKERMLMNDKEEGKKSTPYFLLFALFHVLLILFFLFVIVSTLVSVSKKEEIFLFCGRKLWNLLFIHVVMPFCVAIIPLILSFFVIPILLSYTHKNPFWLFLFPLLFVIAYNATMLSLGIEYVLEAESNERCYAVISQTHLIILSWTFIVIDSVSLFIELMFLFIMLCIQGLDQSVKT
jgi:hypothetical protein